MYKNLALASIFVLIFMSCGGEELSREELEGREQGSNAILARTVSKPWHGGEFAPGRVGGTARSVIHDDPKSFNLLIAEEDSSTSAAVAPMLTWLFDYNAAKREWEPEAASFEIRAREDLGTMDLICTLRDDLYWTWYGQDRREKVTTDDIIFWYNEIRGDPECRSSGYYQQFLELENGEEAHIEIEKIDSLRFVFHFPRIVAEPVLSVNMEIMPRFDYQEAKRRGGAEAVRGIFGVNTDPKRIPSVGMYYLVEYVPAQRLVYRRNPGYWEKDSAGVSIPYSEEEIVRIIPDENTQFLMFKQGETDTYTARPDDLDELTGRENPHYTVYAAGGALSASFWTFNQNPRNSGTAYYDWFTKKEFRQAMSCLLNRDRIISQVYRGLAEPKLTIFPEPNQFYDPEISLQYRFDVRRAETLLASIGMKKDSGGIMRDSQGRAVEFSLTIRADSTVFNDIAAIIRDELEKSGIKVTIRAIDFQKMVGQLMQTFDWETILIGLSGSNIFPSQGSNVWVSQGNLHMWNPNQETPATEWEARVDWLYNEGGFTADPEKARPFWNEFQEILLEQCPLVYLVRPRSFTAVDRRWDDRNIYYDNLSGLQFIHAFLK